MPQTINRRESALTRFDFLKIAAHAETDPRTVAAYMTSAQPTQRHAVQKAIREALSRLGYADPHPPQTRQQHARG